MARIRTIKPEFWTDEKVVDLSFQARLFFIGIWNYADDYGILEWSPKRLKMQLFPADSVDTEALLIELHQHGLIDVYNESRRIPPNSSDYSEALYFSVCGWEKHQKVDKRSTSKYPFPPNSAEGSARKRKRIKEKERDQSSRFADFWSAYPRKEGKADAQKAWKKLDLDSIADKIIADVKARIEGFDQWQDKKFIPHGSTYLNKRRWEDEWEAVKPKATTGKTPRMLN